MVDLSIAIVITSSTMDFAKRRQDTRLSSVVFNFSSRAWISTCGSTGIVVSCHMSMGMTHRRRKRTWKIHSQHDIQHDNPSHFRKCLWQFSVVRLDLPRKSEPSTREASCCCSCATCAWEHSTQAVGDGLKMKKLYHETCFKFYYPFIFYISPGITYACITYKWTYLPIHRFYLSIKSIRVVDHR